MVVGWSGVWWVMVCLVGDRVGGVLGELKFSKGY